jgi:tetratricopeptide (TPR) repeat protein
MRRTLALTLVALPLMAGGAAVATPVQGRTEESRRDMTAETVLAVQAWVTAVRRHTPGKDDDSVAAIQAMSFDARRELNTGLGLFFAVLKSQTVGTSGDAAKRIAEIGRTARQTPGTEAFLKRAAVLHSDAAVYRDSSFDQPTGPVDTSPLRIPQTPLLSNHRLALDKDGEILGSVAADWNWPFARSLLDLLSPRPADDPFVGTWYHATLAHMLGNGLYGEATPHLERAAAVLPDDARILFDRACYAEILGLPKTQVLLSDADIVELVARRAGGRPSKLTFGGAAQLGIPLAEVTNAEAERLFRRALHVDPSFVEARVRLARLLDVRKRHEEAAAELTTALEGKPIGTVAFYAHLFAGRAAQALGRIDDAARHYREAAALFPGAQSALLAQSQAALLGSDVPGTLAPIQRLDVSSSASDPWWRYHLGAGRDVDALLSELWAQIPPPIVVRQSSIRVIANHQSAIENDLLHRAALERK